MKSFDEKLKEMFSKPTDLTWDLIYDIDHELLSNNLKESNIDDNTKLKKVVKKLNKRGYRIIIVPKDASVMILKKEYPIYDDTIPIDKVYNPKIYVGTNKNQECLHIGCPECHGTGRDKWGKLCIHAISCPCPKCSPIC